MKIKFNDSEQQYSITSFRQTGSNLVILKGAGLPEENTSGFLLMNDDETVIGDYSGYTVKYNVLTRLEEGVVMLSNSADCVESEDNPADRYCYTPAPEDIREDADPLTNEELTECVAELMYEASLNKLGLA